MNHKLNLFLFALIVLPAGAVVYFVMPVINFKYYGLPFFLTTAGGSPSFSSGFWMIGSVSFPPL